VTRAALALEQILVPAAFFALMCIPKHYIKPQPLPRQIVSRPLELDLGLSMDAGSQSYYGDAGHVFVCPWEYSLDRARDAAPGLVCFSSRKI
jgi:hypothetical protein